MATRQGIFLARQGRLTSMCHFEHPIRVNDLAPTGRRRRVAGNRCGRPASLSANGQLSSGPPSSPEETNLFWLFWSTHRPPGWSTTPACIGLGPEWRAVAAAMEFRGSIPDAGSRLHAAGERLWVRAGKTLYEIVGDSVRVVAPQVNQTSALPRPVHSNVSGQVWQAHGSRLYLDGELVLSAHWSYQRSGDRRPRRPVVGDRAGRRHQPAPAHRCGISESATARQCQSVYGLYLNGHHPERIWYCRHRNRPDRN